jgi:hypothetical protein
MTKNGILKLVEKHEDVFDKNYPFIQSRDEIVKTDSYFEINRTLLYKFLDKFFGQE